MSTLAPQTKISRRTPENLAMTDVQPPLCDNSSGKYCKACRATGMAHCSDPANCGEMKPMTHHVDCRHSDKTDVIAAAKALVNKLDVIVASDAFKSVFTIAKLHHAEYNGEKFGEELDVLRRLLNIPKPNL